MGPPPQGPGLVGLGMALGKQTVAYQFEAQTSFDGVSLAPQAVAVPQAGQFYQGRAENIGILPVNDPTPGPIPQTSEANRWVTWFELRLAAPAPVGSRIEIVDNTSVDGTVVVLKQIRSDIGGETLVYIDEGFSMPQGAAIRVVGGAGIARYHVTFLDPQGLALIAALASNSQTNAAIAAANAALAANPYSFYQDNPGADGSGTYAESFPIPRKTGISSFLIASLSARVDFPFGAGESATLRLFRYRKTQPFGVFSIQQITSTFVFNNSFDWSWTYPLESLILPGFDLNPLTDSIAASNVYVAGGAPSARALRFDFTYKANS